MLVLTVHTGDNVYLTLPDGTESLVSVLSHDRSNIRLGFDFPRSVVIDREVVHERKLKEMKSGPTQAPRSTDEKDVESTSFNR